MAGRVIHEIHFDGGELLTRVFKVKRNFLYFLRGASLVRVFAAT